MGFELFFRVRFGLVKKPRVGFSGTRHITNCVLSLTGDSFKNGIPKVWGFTNAFLNLVEFHPEHAQNTILEAVHDKVGTYELRPLLQQVQEGMKLDQDLSKKFGLQPLAHELRLSEKVLNDCNFIRTENYNNKVQDTENVITRIVSNDDIDIKEEICY